MMRRALSHKQLPPATKYSSLNKPATDESITLTFGGPLLEANQYALSQLIDHLHNYVMSEGLFRKPGNKHRMETLVTELEAKPPSEAFSSRRYNAHDYASVLKKYLSELSEPILMKRHLGAYIQTSGRYRCMPSQLISSSQITLGPQIIMLFPCSHPFQLWCPSPPRFAVSNC